MRLRILALAAILLLPTVLVAQSSGDRVLLDQLIDAAVVQPAPADDYTTFEACDSIIENTTNADKTVTVTICNTSEQIMNVDVGGDGAITTIPAGKCKTIIVTIPAGKSLHADENGKYKLGPSPAVVQARPASL